MLVGNNPNSGKYLFGVWVVVNSLYLIFGYSAGGGNACGSGEVFVVMGFGWVEEFLRFTSRSSKLQQRRAFLWFSSSMIFRFNQPVEVVTSLAVIGRAYPEILPEGGGKVRGVLQSDGIGNLGNIHLA